MSTYRQVVPNSFVNQTNEAYEHLLAWLSPAGGVRQWLFSSTDGETEYETDMYKVEGLNSVRSIPSYSAEEISVTTGSLDPELFDYVRSLLRSNKVYKLHKDMTMTPISISSSKIRRDNKLKEYSISLSFMPKEEPILNV